MIELLKPFISEIITGIVGIAAWIFERSRRKTEILSLQSQLAAQENENNKSVVDLYQEALDDLKKRYDEKFVDLDKEIKVLRDNLNIWKEKYSQLKSEFENYKLNHEK